MIGHTVLTLGVPRRKPVTVPQPKDHPPSLHIRPLCSWGGGFAAVFAIFLGIQIISGAWSSDLAGDPDEAAHAVTSLMVRDYLVTGLSESPLKFAEAYYVRWPKVALGHYPPGYYLPNALALTVQSDLRMLWIMQALWAAALATLTAMLAANRMNLFLAWTAGVSVILLPVAIKAGTHVMADLQLTSLCLAALIAWAKYLETPSVRWSLAFGFLAAAAILTKGSGLCLAVVPPLATMLAGRLSLIKCLSWWIAAVPVAVLAMPWMVFSATITREGMAEVSPGEFLRMAIDFYPDALRWTLGWPWLVLVGAGLVMSLRLLLNERRFPPVDATCWAMVAGTLLILFAVPAGLSSRYLLPMIPALIVPTLAMMRTHPFARFPWAGLFLVSSAVAHTGPSVWKGCHGFREAAVQAMAVETPLSEPNLLISSDPRGEGAVIAAAAFRLLDRRHSARAFLRGSKTLAETNWNTTHYELRAQSSEGLLSLLEQEGIGVVLIDHSIPEADLAPHTRLLDETLASKDSGWTKTCEIAATRNDSEASEKLITIWQRTPPATPRKSE